MAEAIADGPTAAESQPPPGQAVTAAGVALGPWHPHPPDPMASNGVPAHLRASGQGKHVGPWIANAVLLHRAAGGRIGRRVRAVRVVVWASVTGAIVRLAPAGQAHKQTNCCNVWAQGTGTVVRQSTGRGASIPPWDAGEPRGPGCHGGATFRPGRFTDNTQSSLRRVPSTSAALGGLRCVLHLGPSRHRTTRRPCTVPSTGAAP